MGINNEKALLPCGTILQGRYRVEQALKSGGFGNTYVVWDLHFDERWAMKEFFMKGVSERDNTISISVSAASKPHFEAQRAKFNKEAKRLRKLHHPGIVHVEDLFEDNGTSYYIMDYIGGGSLSELVKRQGPLSEGRVRQLLPELLDALGYVHAQQMWHLDIKPGNILLKEDGHPVLIDFGASKQLGVGGANSTSVGMTYTQGYAPSEQIDQNIERIGPWTDLYALGATLYNLLTGEIPPLVSELHEFEAESFKFPKGLSEQMRTLILWLMNTNRRKRPQSVAEVREFMNLDTTLPSPVNVFDDGTRLPDTKPVPRPKSSFKYVKYAIALCAIVALGVGVWFVGGKFWKSSSQTEDTIVEEEVNPIQTFTVNNVSFNMINVDGGTFMMGSDNGSSDERPVHEVELSSYSIGETEVTQELWLAVMGSERSQWNSYGRGDDYPAYYVSWDDCQNFIRKLNELTASQRPEGRVFRLPKEAEWEFAARGGNLGKDNNYLYSGSDTLKNVGWYKSNSGNCTHPVKTKAPNELGLYDMSGNVWEWCADVYNSSFYSNSPRENPYYVNSSYSTIYYVYRGGSRSTDDSSCRCANRDETYSYNSGEVLGFRLAM